MTRFGAPAGASTTRAFALALAIVSPASVTQAQPLAPARPAGFAGDCASMAAALAGLPDTRITGTDTVAAGTLKVGGGPMTHALQQGFAVLSSDAGHIASQNLAFGLDPQARLDYGYQAVGTLTPMAKSVI